MPKTETPLIPQNIPELPLHDVHYKTLGRGAVNALNYAVDLEFRADQNARFVEQGKALETKKTMPGHKGPISRKIGQLTGSVMSDSEAEFVIAAANRTNTSAIYGEWAAKSREDAAEELKDVRLKIADIGLDPRKETYLDAYCRVNLPKIFHHGKDQYKDLNWAEWLSQKADDDQLMNFLQWHVGKAQEHQDDPNVAAEIEQQKRDYKIAIRRGVEEGWLSQSAESAIAEVDRIKVYIGDTFDTVMQDYGGYHERGASDVVIAGPLEESNANKTLKANIKHATKHEFNHAVLGGLGARWMDEALTEHIALVMDGEYIEFLGIDQGAAYTSERLLLLEFLRGGNKKIDVALATRAYSEGDGSLTEDRATLLDELEESWGDYMVGEAAKISSPLLMLDAYVRAMENIYLKQGMPEMEARSKAADITRETLEKYPQLIFKWT